MELIDLDGLWCGAARGPNIRTIRIEQNSHGSTDTGTFGTCLACKYYSTEDGQSHSASYSSSTKTQMPADI